MCSCRSTVSIHAPPWCCSALLPAGQNRNFTPFSDAVNLSKGVSDAQKEVLVASLITIQSQHHERSLYKD